MPKKLIKKDNVFPCRICGKDGERLVFDDGTTQVQHGKEWNQKAGGFIIIAHNNG